MITMSSLPVLVQRVSAVSVVGAGVCTADASPSEEAPPDVLVYSASAYSSV